MFQWQFCLISGWTLFVLCSSCNILKFWCTHANHRHNDRSSAYSACTISCWEETNWQGTIPWHHLCALVHNTTTMHPVSELNDCTTYVHYGFYYIVSFCKYTGISERHSIKRCILYASFFVLSPFVISQDCPLFLISPVNESSSLIVVLYHSLFSHNFNFVHG